MTRLRLATVWLGGCSGCHMSLLDLDERLIEIAQHVDLVYTPLIDAVVTSEDSRFYEHEGVDPLSLLRAVVSNIRTGGIAQGGSTLTQQYVKNAFVGDQQTLHRKVQEAVIAIQLEREQTKDEILERYLNTVYFGDGAYGVQAAAQHYFNVNARRLNLNQSATLAGILTAPEAYDPIDHPFDAKFRRDFALDRMVRYGYLDAEDLEAVLLTELGHHAFVVCQLIPLATAGRMFEAGALGEHQQLPRRRFVGLRPRLRDALRGRRAYGRFERSAGAGGACTGTGVPPTRPASRNKSSNSQV